MTVVEEVHQMTVVEGRALKHKKQKNLLGIEALEQTAGELG